MMDIAQRSNAEEDGGGWMMLDRHCRRRSVHKAQAQVKGGGWGRREQAK